MTVQSLPFFLFVALVLAFYYALHRRQQNVLLLTASYIFYVSISWQFALLLALMTSANYWCGKGIEVRHRPKRWLFAGIGLDLLVLLLFKTASFYIADVVDLVSQLGLKFQTDGLRVLLPIGLSFYVLQAISYLVDVFRKQIPACSDLADFALYLAYFPKLTSGPIERARSFLPQLARERSVDNRLLSQGFALIVIGLFRKLVVADTLLRAIPPKLFQAPGEFSSLELAAWTIAYAVGLYNDFCGYTNLARGISALFGIKLSRNFDQPFFARNISEFWSKWHMTLSQWLRDYIYFPISRALVRRNPSQANPLNIVVPPLVTMLASGLWHGPTLNYLSWGFLMGLLLIGERILTLGKPLVPARKKPSWKRMLSPFLVILLLAVALIVFLMGFSRGFQFLLRVFTSNSWTWANSRVFLVILPALGVDIVQFRKKNELVFLSWPLVFRSLLLAAALLLIFLFSQSQLEQPFIYQGF